MGKWIKLEGPALLKVQNLLDRDDNFYVYHMKINGKTIFARDHGVTTLYVLGIDDYWYSNKFCTTPENISYDILKELVFIARMGVIIPKSGVYKNFKSR